VPLLFAAGNAALVIVMLTRVQAAPLTGVAAFAMPAWLGLCLLWTPDGGLLFFWHLALLAMFERRVRWLLPLATAGMTAFKITGLPLALLLLLVFRSDRERLRVAAVGVVTACVSLVFLGLSSLGFQAGHRAGDAGFRWAGPVETLLGQVAILGPALAVVCGFASRSCWRHRHAIRTAGDDLTDRLATLSLWVFGAVLFLSFFVRIEPNWLAPIHMPLIVTAAAVYKSQPEGGSEQRRLRLWPITAGLQLCFTALVLVQLIWHPMQLGRADPLSRLRAWSSWAAAFPDTPLVLSDRYQWHAELFLHRDMP